MKQRARKKTAAQQELDAVDAIVEEQCAEGRRCDRIVQYWRARGVELHCVIQETDATANDGVPVYAIRSDLVMRVPQ